jgi:hypothetical protein
MDILKIVEILLLKLMISYKPVLIDKLQPSILISMEFIKLKKIIQNLKIKRESFIPVLFYTILEILSNFVDLIHLISYIHTSFK